MSERSADGSASAAARATRPPKEWPTQVHRCTEVVRATASTSSASDLDVVRRRVAVPRRLELSAQVDGRDRVAGGGDRRQHGDEVLLRPGEAGHEQDRGPVVPGGRGGDQRGELDRARLGTRVLPTPGGSSRKGGVLTRAERYPSARDRVRGWAGTMAAVSRTIAVANQKGGVAKTTTVASLGSALAEQGRKVLLVDLDAQSCLTFSLGLDPEAVELCVHDVLLGRVGAAMAIQPTEDGVDLLPATIELAGTEAQLLSRPGREFVLRTALAEVSAAYDVILLDCSPSLGVLTLNALTAADEVIIPLQCEMLSHRGVGQLLDTISRRAAHPEPRAAGAGGAADDVRRADQPRPGGAR